MAVTIAILGYACYCAFPGPHREGRIAGYLIACFGVVALLAIGLLNNTVLPWLGVGGPLARLPTLIGIDIAFVVLAFVGRRRWGWGGLTRASLWRVPSPVLVGRAALIIGPPAVAAAGAAALDNGHSGWLTVVLLIAAGSVLVGLALKAPHVSRGTICAAVYGIALAMLLMTSLRGRYITGHDVQHEYFVFELTRANWHWSINAFRDPYNACLSITILPTMLAGLFHVSDVMIYKFLFQLIFALVPVGVFLIADRLAGPRRAVLAVLIFVSFPTFFQDMPSLNRQEIALLLVTGMTLLIIDRLPEALRVQQAQLLFLGVGVISAHYSTSFLMVAQLTIASVLLAIGRFAMSAHGMRHGPRVGQHRVGAGSVPILTLPVAVFLVLATVVWQSPLTHTGGNVGGVLRNVLKAVTGQQSSDSRSADLSASLFGGTGPSPTQLLDEQTNAALTQRLPGRQYLSQAVVLASPLQPAADEKAPLTAVGKTVNAVGIAPYSLNSALRSGSAKLIQVLVLVGFAGVLLRRPRRWQLQWDREYQMLCVGAFGVVGALVALPFLTLDYGLLRAFQQGLIVLALPAAVGCAAVGSIAGNRGRQVASVALPAIFFVSSTGIIATVTGGYLPQLHLANSGANYDSQYVSDADAALATWLGANLAPGSRAPSDLQADVAASSQLLALLGRGASSDVIPALIQRNAYVYLSSTNVLRDRALTQYESQDLLYDYPLELLQENKNRVADTGSARVYR